MDDILLHAYDSCEVPVTMGCVRREVDMLERAEQFLTDYHVATALIYLKRVYGKIVADRARPRTMYAAHLSGLRSGDYVETLGCFVGVLVLACKYIEERADTASIAECLGFPPACARQCEDTAFRHLLQAGAGMWITCCDVSDELRSGERALPTAKLRACRRIVPSSALYF
jgi:hypothetical protein